MTTMTSRLSPPRVLPLTIAVMLLLLSVRVVTFAKNAGTALGLTWDSAQAAPTIAAPPLAAANVSETPSASEAAIKQPPSQQVGDSEKALLQDLRRRREQLDARARALDERSNVVEAAEARLQAKIDRLASLQDKIDQLESARSKRQDANWGGLVKVYESMKPRDAAAIFNVLDMHVLLEVLDRMNDRKAAGVLAAMEPERARVATQMLAQMRLQQEALVSQSVSDSVPKPSTQQ